MAGSMLSEPTPNLNAIRTPSDSASFSPCMPITTVINRWEVEYARFVNYPPIHGLISTHPSLIPQTKAYRKQFQSRAWLKSTDLAIYVKIVPTSSNHPILMVFHDCKFLEEHYVSRMHFSWPQVACISGFPARGTRAVFLSYKDGVNSDQIQKFVLRFSSTHETETFIAALKGYLEDMGPEINNANFGSGVSSQQEFDPSNCPPNKSADESWMSGISLDSSSCYIPTTDFEAAQPSNGQELISSNEAAEIISTFPPSFTSFLMNCCPTAEQGTTATKRTKSEEVDFKKQIMKYMNDPSFQDILTKAEQLITELGDNIKFP